MTLDIVAIAEDGQQAEETRRAFETAGFAGGTSFSALAARTGAFSAQANRGAAAGTGEWILFLRGACRPAAGAMQALAAAVVSRPDAAGFELRQLPLETEHHVDPVTLESDFIAGRALAVKRSAFQQAGGFDHRLFGRCADADLCWRLRALGGRLYSLPTAAVLCAPVAEPEEQAMLAYTGTQLGLLLLHWKYRSPAAAIGAGARYLAQSGRLPHFAGVRRQYLKNYLRHLALLWTMAAWRLAHRRLYRASRGTVPARLSGAFSAPRGLSPLPPVSGGPFISVVVRTHRRAGRLRQALASVANQTYRNFEVVVVEDGEPTARDMLQAEFAHLPLRYHATGRPAGRSRAGNIGMEMAAGEYINMLDDDDYFYPDHLEQMAAQAALYPDADMIIANAMAQRQNVTAEDPFTAEVTELEPIVIDRLDIFTMCQSCQLADNSVLFKKELFTRLGGMDERLDAHEDWALWLKYLAAARRAHPGRVDIPRATAVFTQPADPAEAARRAREYRRSDAAFFADPSLRFEVTLAQMRAFYDGALADAAHLSRLGRLDAFIEERRQQNGGHPGR